jgi:hypothetical protein
MSDMSYIATKENTMLWKKVTPMIAAAAVVMAGTTAAVAGTQSGTEDVATQATAVPGGDQLVEIGFEGVDVELTPEDIAEINSDTDGLVKHLEGLGYSVVLETGEDGVRFPVLDEEDAVLIGAVTDYYDGLFAAEVKGWSDEEKAEWNAFTDEFIADLAAEGVTAVKVEVAPGVFDIDWTDEVEAAIDASELGFIDGGFIDGDFELTPEDVEMFNAETDALVEHLEGLGFSVSLETDDDGVRFPVIDEDDQSLFDAVDEFYRGLFVAEVAGWSDAEKAEWNAMTDAFIAELAGEGVTAVKVEVAPGVFDIDWTEEVEAAVDASEPGFVDDGS